MSKTLYCTRQIPQEFVDRLQKYNINLKFWEEDRDMTVDDLTTETADCHGILAIGMTRYDGQFLRNHPKLEVLVTLSVGYDHIDIDAATARRIQVGHTPHVLSKATADVAFLLMQMVARKALFHHQRIRDNQWGPSHPFANLGQDLQDKVVGIFGLGRIGIEFAKACKGAFNMKVIYHNRSHNEQAEKELDAEYVSFDQLVEQSDVISIHCNLTEENRGKFNKEVFAKMKKTAILVNTARGGICNEEDLIDALKNNVIFGAGLDVFEKEPINNEHPLLQLDNVTALPHIGSATIETRNAMMSLAVENCIVGLSGKTLPNLVNTDVHQE